MQMSIPIRVLLVGQYGGDVPATEVLLGNKHLEIVGRFENGEDAVNHYASLDPDLVLIDVAMGGMTGFETARYIKEQCQKIRTVITSEHFNGSLLFTAMDLSLDGYLPKDALARMVDAVIDPIRHGKACFEYAITRLLTSGVPIQN